MDEGVDVDGVDVDVDQAGPNWTTLDVDGVDSGVDERQELSEASTVHALPGSTCPVRSSFVQCGPLRVSTVHLARFRRARFAGRPMVKIAETLQIWAPVASRHRRRTTRGSDCWQHNGTHTATPDLCSGCNSGWLT